MKRIIKFREWNGFEMEYEPPISMYSSASINECFFDSDLMQFTGVLDLNGKEIYDGDIVKLISQDCAGEDVENTFEVVYQAPSFMFKTIKSEVFKTDVVVYFDEEVTVIGNIYEKN